MTGIKLVLISRVPSKSDSSVAPPAVVLAATLRYLLSAAMKAFSGLSDFFLRKAFKFALKRNLGKYLASELDPNQLDVQLGQGTIELKQLLLNCSELNQQLVS